MVKWAVNHFHLYLFGMQFTVVTDHKPLVSIFSNPLARPSAKIERWCLNLQSNNFDIIYRSGKSNPADYMSRHPVDVVDSDTCKKSEEYVHFVCEQAKPKALSFTKIANATANDKTLQIVIKCLDSKKMSYVQRL